MPLTKSCWQCTYLAVKYFRHFVEGRVFHLLTDHKPLTFVLASNSASYIPLQARHLDFISQFISDIRHVKGEGNAAADALSHFTVDALVLNGIGGLDFHNLANAQQSDPEIRQIMDGTVPHTSSAKVGSIPLQSSDLTILCDVSTGVPWLLVHCWPTSSLSWISVSFHSCGLFTHWPEAIPIVDMVASSVTQSFVSGWVARFGIPSVVTTDRGHQFESTLWKELTHMLGCTRLKTTAYLPAANGLVEFFH